ncbi:hypothetical protein V501_04519 [Pseudogymnoascus sp. VKM F-4519 (FW-2642)]|nr:hypothetical protein V501_04519 [Pseudogymnoascus sp. VKM F-4519 (FW-2642)]
MIQNFPIPKSRRHLEASQPTPQFPTTTLTMAKKAKSRTIAVRLISMAMTGYYKTLIRPRVHRPLSMLKYDPVVRKQVLFLEQKRKK